MECSKRKIFKEHEKKKDQNAFNNGCKCVSRKCESYMMCFKGDNPYQTIMIECECAIFDKVPNEVVLNLYMFCSRMLNRILRDVYGTSIVTIDGKMFLTNTIIKEEFLHPQKLGVAATNSDVFNLSRG